MYADLRTLVVIEFKLEIVDIDWLVNRSVFVLLQQGQFFYACTKHFELLKVEEP